MGVNIYSQEILSDEDIRSLLESEPLPNERTIEEIRQDLHLALERNDIDELLSHKTHNRCDQFILERTRVKENLLESGEHEWLEGFNSITPVSSDLLCVTLYYPGLGGGS